MKKENILEASTVLHNIVQTNVRQHQTTTTTTTHISHFPQRSFSVQVTETSEWTTPFSQSNKFLFPCGVCVSATIVQQLAALPFGRFIHIHTHVMSILSCEWMMMGWAQSKWEAATLSIIVVDSEKSLYSGCWQLSPIAYHMGRMCVFNWQPYEWANRRAIVPSNCSRIASV